MPSGQVGNDTFAWPKGPRIFRFQRWWLIYGTRETAAVDESTNITLLMLRAPIVVSVGWQCLGQITFHLLMEFVPPLLSIFVQLFLQRQGGCFEKVQFSRASYVSIWFPRPTLIHHWFSSPDPPFSETSQVGNRNKTSSSMSLTLLPYFCVTWRTHKTSTQYYNYAKR